MFVASKMSEVVPMSAEKLIIFTDNSLSFTEFLSWELLLLQTLGWELTPSTPFSFLEFILQQPFFASCPLMDKIRRHSEYLLIIATSEYQFLSISPSLLATSAVLTAFSGLVQHSRKPSLVAVLSRLVGRPEKEINFVKLAIERLIESYREFKSESDKPLVNNVAFNHVLVA